MYTKKGPTARLKTARDRRRIVGKRLLRKQLRKTGRNK